VCENVALRWAYGWNLKLPQGKGGNREGKKVLPCVCLNRPTQPVDTNYQFIALRVLSVVRKSEITYITRY
jgi:hypothetical protein